MCTGILSSLVKNISMFRRLSGVLMISHVVSVMGSYPQALWAKWHDYGQHWVHGEP